MNKKIKLIIFVTLYMLAAGYSQFSFAYEPKYHGTTKINDIYRTLHKDVKNIVTDLESNEITYLEIGNLENPDDFETITNALQNNNSITTLKFFNTDLKRDEANYLSDFLKTNNTLVNLQLIYSVIGDNELQNIFYSLREVKTLQTIKISGFDFIYKNGVISCINDLLFFNDSLVQLDFTGSIINNDSNFMTREFLLKTRNNPFTVITNYEIFESDYLKNQRPHIQPITDKTFSNLSKHIAERDWNIERDMPPERLEEKNEMIQTLDDGVRKLTNKYMQNLVADIDNLLDEAGFPRVDENASKQLPEPEPESESGSEHDEL